MRTPGWIASLEFIATTTLHRSAEIGERLGDCRHDRLAFRQIWRLPGKLELTALRPRDTLTFDGTFREVGVDSANFRESITGIVHNRTTQHPKSKARPSG